MQPDEKPMSSSAEQIQAHLDDITQELHHGKNSHEDPSLPENWERLERAERGESLEPAEPEVDPRGVPGPEPVQRDMTMRNVEAVGGQAPL
jgi:hypothetical protein